MASSPGRCSTPQEAEDVMSKVLQRQDRTDEKILQVSDKIDRVLRWQEDLLTCIDEKLQEVKESIMERIDRIFEQQTEWQQVHMQDAQQWQAMALRGIQATVSSAAPDTAAPAAAGAATFSAPAGSGASGYPAAAAAATLAVAPLPIALLFPGQGSQYVLMMTFVKDIPAVQDMLARARPILGFDVLELCLNGPESKLSETSYCQPTMFIAGLAGLEKLRRVREEAVTRCQVMAGVSLGEYTALCAAGVFSFEDGLRLVKIRGEAMEAAGREGSQALLSVVGLDRSRLVELCREAAEREGGDAVCQISNELFPRGFSVAGTEAAVHFLQDLAARAGALQTKVLPRTCGFHTPLMRPAQDALAQALEEALPRMSPPTRTVYMNATAEPVKPGTHPRTIVELLKRQLTSAVLWEPSVRGMIKAGILEFYEVGPMKQIKGVMKRIDTRAWETMTNVDV